MTKCYLYSLARNVWLLDRGWRKEQRQTTMSMVTTLRSFFKNLNKMRKHSIQIPRCEINTFFLGEKNTRKNKSYRQIRSVSNNREPPNSLNVAAEMIVSTRTELHTLTLSSSYGFSLFDLLKRKIQSTFLSFPYFFIVSGRCRCFDPCFCRL